MRENLVDARRIRLHNSLPRRSFFPLLFFERIHGSSLFFFLFLFLSFFFQQAFKHSRVIDWFMNTSRATPLRWGKKKKSVDKLHPRSDVGFRGWNRMAGTKGQCMIPLTSRGCLENLSYLWFSKNQIEPFFFSHTRFPSVPRTKGEKGIRRNSSNFEKNYLKEKKRRKKTRVNGMK